MGTIKVSIARALNEVKLLSKRIEKTSSNSSFLQYQIGENGKPTPLTAEGFESTVQSLNDMIQRRAAIKNAITLANAQTKVKIGDKTFSIAEAIALKDGVTSQAKILLLAQRNYQATVNQVQSINEDMEERLSRLLEQNFGKDKRASADDYNAIAVPFKKSNEAKIMDEEAFLKSLQKNQEDLELFESEVDFVLSEANAMTQIEIPE